MLAVLQYLFTPTLGPETIVKLNQQILGRQLFTLHIIIFNHSHIYPPVLSVALFAPPPFPKYLTEGLYLSFLHLSSKLIHPAVNGVCQ